MTTIELRDVIKNDITDFDGMHDEIEKCQLYNKVTDNILKLNFS